ncbi:hypothetical protein QTH87_20120 [Variovorax sp. J22P168]|nr:hypothetical protein [Variovorax sp. J22P168]
MFFGMAQDILRVQTKKYRAQAAAGSNRKPTQRVTNAIRQAASLFAGMTLAEMPLNS